MSYPWRFWRGYAKHLAGTVTHKLWVAYYLLRYALFAALPHERWKLVRRAIVHDLSKFSWVEASAFAITIFDLKQSTYASAEYERLLAVIRPAIQRHYARNAHHPEHWRRGYADMAWLDKIEMVADWAAAVRRHEDGDLARSIDLNMTRFGYNAEEALRLAKIAAKMGAL